VKANNEIPLLASSLYLSNDGGTAAAELAQLGSFRVRGFTVSSNKRPLGRDPLIRDTSQVGSLAGAAYLLNNNAGVLSGAQ